MLCRRGCSSFRSSAVLSTVLFLAIGPLFEEQAQAQEVVRDQYIVKPRLMGANADGLLDTRLEAQDLRVKKTIGAYSLVGPSAASRYLAAKAPAEFVPADPSNSVCKELIKSGVASFCEPDYKVSINASANDPLFSQLWGLSASQGIDAPRAWDKSTGSAAVVVAVIDTGIDYNHPDLQANVWSNPGEIPGNGIDDDHDGYVDDVHGINVTNHTGNPMDDNGHGTHVSGTIGAAGNNAVGVAGINWHVNIMGLKFLNAHGSGSVSGAIEAINYMLAMKQRGINVRVSSNSWGGGGYSQALYEAISRANDAGILFVAAAGNDSNDNDATPSYPASFELPNVVSVAALDQSQNLAWFSNYGAASVDIAAPGVGILSTTPNNTYSSYSGTSMATPHVSGALALLLAAEPSLSNAEALDRMYNSGVALSSLNGVVRSGRMLNVGRMLNNLTQPLPTPTPEQPSCEYYMANTNLPPDTSADSGTLLMQEVDEGSFKTVQLPFAFNFDGRLFDVVTVSPNGLLYMGDRSNSGMDYQNGQTAPINSIAVLQSDLVSNVWEAHSADSVTFRWLSYYYANLQAGSADLRLTLHADGSIQEWLSFSAPAIVGLVQQAATIGITGHSASASHTYAYNSSVVSSGLAIQYTPLCGVPPQEQPVQLAGLNMWGIERGTGRNKLTRTLLPGGLFKVRVATSNSGVARVVPVNFMLGNQMCNDSATIELRSGNLSLRGRLPRAATSFKKFGVIVENLSVARRVSAQNSRSRVRHRSVSPETFGRLCRNLGSSLRSLR